MKSIRLSPILCAVLTLASAVLFYVFPTYTPVNMEMTKQHEFILAGIALCCAVLSLVIYFIATRKVILHASVVQRCGHLLAFFIQAFILTNNLSRFIKAFKYDFVPVMSTNTVGIIMLVLAGLLIVASVLHPRKVQTTETEV